MYFKYNAMSSTNGFTCYCCDMFRPHFLVPSSGSSCFFFSMCATYPSKSYKYLRTETRAPWRWHQEIRPKHDAAITTKSVFLAGTKFYTSQLTIPRCRSHCSPGCPCHTVTLVLTGHLPVITAYQDIPRPLLFHVHPFHRPARPNKIPNPPVLISLPSFSQIIWLSSA